MIRPFFPLLVFVASGLLRAFLVLWRLINPGLPHTVLGVRLRRQVLTIGRLNLSILAPIHPGLLSSPDRAPVVVSLFVIASATISPFRCAMNDDDIFFLFLCFFLYVALF